MSISFTAQWDSGRTIDLEQGPVRDMEFGADLNLHNRNASDILGLLGYHEQAEPTGEFWGAPILDAFGDADPDDFLGRVLIARGLLDVATDDANGRPGFTEGGPGTGRPTMIDVGRAPGRLAEILDDLEAVTRDAKAHGGIVAWG